MGHSSIVFRFICGARYTASKCARSQAFWFYFDDSMNGTLYLCMVLFFMWCACQQGNTCFQAFRASATMVIRVCFFCFQEHYFSRISWRLCVVSATLSVHKVCREATCARNEGGVLLSQVAPGSFQNAALWANLLKISSTGLPACMPEECKGRLMEQEKFKWVFFLFIGPLIKHFDVVLCWAKI